MAKSILSYLFSLIGFVPINELQSLQQQQQKQQQWQRRRITGEESCHYLTSSTFVIEEEKEHNEKSLSIAHNDINGMHDWLFNLPKMALCQILTSTIADYPQVADGIYSRHYEKNFYKRKKSMVNNTNDDLEELKSIQSQAHEIAHSLDNLRPSEQFGRASEVVNRLYELLHTIEVQRHSFISLFGLIILAQESLNCPSEVRQHVFADVKFGRAIVLEISKVLKNFNQYHAGDIKYKWSLLSNQSTLSWFDTLQFICTKLARYDVTWEYRKEYQEVILISEKYYNKRI